MRVRLRSISNGRLSPRAAWAAPSFTAPSFSRKTATPEKGSLLWQVFSWITPLGIRMEIAALGFSSEEEDCHQKRSQSLWEPYVAALPVRVPYPSPLSQLLGC